MKTISAILFLVTTTLSAQVITPSVCFEPIGLGSGARVEIGVGRYAGIYTSYTQGVYRMPSDRIPFRKVSAGFVSHTKSGVFFQYGMVYSRSESRGKDNNYSFSGKYYTPELGFGYKYKRGLNIGVRYNPLKVESTFDVGYSFRLNKSLYK